MVAAALIVASLACAQSPDRPSFPATRIDDAPAIDGRLDDAVWREASFVGDFAQLEPVEDGPPSVPTEVAVTYDDDALYVAARMFIAAPDDLEAVMTRRDDTGAAERIIVSLDTFNDRRTAYSFAVTAAGVRADWLHTDDTTGNRDHSFDPVWTADIHRYDDRWTAEMRIPFSQLRFRGADVHRWGININRFIPHKNEDIFWIVVPKGETGWSSYFGELACVEGIDTPRRIELLPYVAGDATLTSTSLVDEDDPFADELDLGGRAGLDAKMGLGPSLTLDLTVNPDFGQVEADPAVVNLSAFETQFAERRPFFVEGSQLLSGGGPAYYYSRRIGAPPRGRVGAAFADVPDSTRILGAAKVTGRLPSRLSVGAVTALTQRITAETFDPDTGMRAEVPIEPLTTYNVLRLEQELGANSSKVGASLTGVYRSLDDDSVLADQFNRFATTGGLDWNLRLADARYEIVGAVGFSAIGGEEPAIDALQRSSAHYYQRPDADHVELDPDRNYLFGWSAGIGGSKRSGAWRWGASTGIETPGFDLNDAGILFAADDISASGFARYYHTTPSELLHAWDIGIDAIQEWNTGGDRDPGFATLSVQATMPNFWRFGVWGQAVTPGFDDRATRGGPLLGTGWAHNGGVSLSNSFAARTRWSAGVEWSESEIGWSGATVHGDVTVRPVDRLQLTLAPRYRREENARQYVDTIEGAGGATFGKRYLFATVARRELALRTRLQVAFTPELIVELYAEPFASSGAFTEIGELPEAGSRELREYGTGGTTIEKMDGSYTISDGAEMFTIADPDFTVLSLRSTMVLRWEFLPGSTAYLVWQQNRGDRLTRARLGGTADDLFSAPGANTVALKVAYWWPVD